MMFINNLYFASVFSKVYEHLSISITSVIIGSLLAIPVGILLSQNKKLSAIFVGVCSILQTIPSLALLAIMVPILGVGKKPAIWALVIYSLLPILRNTVIGMQNVDPNIIDAAKGMGFSRFQIIFKVQLPLAVSTIFTGVRLSTTYVITWATIASYVGAGGLGDYIFAGLNNYNINLIILGTISITFMTLLVDFILAKVETKILIRVNKVGDNYANS